MDELLKNLDLEEMDFFYHITAKGNGAKIMNLGLYMEDSDLRSTTIQITEEMLENFESYCKDEFKTGIVERNEMVIIGCAKGESEYLVEKSCTPINRYGQKLSYLINSENILGYIDLETLNIVCNPEYIHSYTL